MWVQHSAFRCTVCAVHSWLSQPRLEMRGTLGRSQSSYHFATRWQHLKPKCWSLWRIQRSLEGWHRMACLWASQLGRYCQLWGTTGCWYSSSSSIPDQNSPSLGTKYCRALSNDGQCSGLRARWVLFWHLPYLQRGRLPGQSSYRPHFDPAWSSSEWVCSRWRKSICHWSGWRMEGLGVSFQRDHLLTNFHLCLADWTVSVGQWIVSYLRLD